MSGRAIRCGRETREARRTEIDNIVECGDGRHQLALLPRTQFARPFGLLEIIDRIITVRWCEDGDIDGERNLWECKGRVDGSRLGLILSATETLDGRQWRRLEGPLSVVSMTSYGISDDRRRQRSEETYDAVSMTLSICVRSASNPLMSSIVKIFGGLL